MNLDETVPVGVTGRAAHCGDATQADVDQGYELGDADAVIGVAVARAGRASVRRRRYRREHNQQHTAYRTPSRAHPPDFAGSRALGQRERRRTPRAWMGSLQREPDHAHPRSGTERLPAAHSRAALANDAQRPATALGPAAQRIMLPINTIGPSGLDTALARSIVTAAARMAPASRATSAVRWATPCLSG